MKQSKIIKIEKNQNNLIRLLEHQSPEERQEFLNSIDYILCDFLEFKLKDLPWCNLGKQSEKWDKLIRKVRIIVSKIHKPPMIIKVFLGVKFVKQILSLLLQNKQG